MNTVDQLRDDHREGLDVVPLLQEYFQFSDTDTFVEDVLALEVSRLVLDTKAGSERLKSLLDLIDIVVSVRKTTRGEIQHRLELESLGHFHDLESGDIDGLDQANQRRRVARKADLERLHALRPTVQDEHFAAALRSIVEHDATSVTASSETESVSTLSRIKAAARCELENTRDRLHHGLRLPSDDPSMDERWSRLDREIRDEIIQEVRQTIIMWRLIEPALRDESRPGALPALLWGHQLPFKDDDNTTTARSTLHKKVRSLRSAWAYLLNEDPRAFLWIAEVFATAADQRGALDAFEGFATTPEWEGRSGRKSSNPSTVTSWKCNRCGCTYSPGDPTHNSPNPKNVKTAKNSFEPRVVIGLPSEAEHWHRLMCGNDTESQPCWLRGGVLTPQFLVRLDR